MTNWSKRAKTLTATMVACIDDAQDAGGELVRYQGGYWAARSAPRFAHNGRPAFWHGGSTVNALVARGEAEFTEWQEGRNGRFPIAMKLKPETDSAVIAGGKVGA